MRVDQDVLEVIGRATTEGVALRLVGELDRRLYERTAKALEAAGGKWNRKAGAHLFEGDAAEAIEPILMTGEIVSQKRAFDAFYTPADLASRVAHLADIRSGHLVLEPSSGPGALVSAAKARGGEVVAYEIDPTAADKLKARTGSETRVTVADFLTIKPEPIFDRVLMNPPFSAQQDMKHVLHAFGFLKPGGRLVAIMAASIKFRETTVANALRALVAAHGGTISDLPDGSFKESGTLVNAVVLAVDAVAQQVAA